MTGRALALLGGIPVRTAPWPAWPERGADDETALLSALREGDWGGYPLPNVRTARFASAFAARHDAAFALPVANGTVSLELALQALEVTPGAEVIVPAYTFEATAAAVLFAGCVPVFADVLPGTLCLDPDAAAAAVSPRTEAILPVHLAMSLADMDATGALAERHHLRVLEDCAHAHGARWRGRGAGSLGDAGSFSFQTSKLLSAGEGGIVTCREEAVYDRLWALANCGRQRPGAKAPQPVLGHNYRMTDLQAALLEVALARLDAQHARRERNAALLEAALRDLPGLSVLEPDPRQTTRAIYQYVFRFSPTAHGGLPRDAFVAALQAEGVPCDGRFYDVVPQSELFSVEARRYPAWAQAPRPGRYPVAEAAAYEESVWLPHWLLLGNERDTADIARAITKVCAHAAALAAADHPAIRRAGRSRHQR